MQADTDFDVVIIGGGIVGLASAYKLSRDNPSVRIAVLEKENRLASHQTGHNSGVIHSGLYYTPGSAKALTCAAGRGQLVEFARKHRIPFEICGKIVVATDERERPRLERILRNGMENGLEGLEQIGPDAIREIEPSVTGVAGIRVPAAGVIDFRRVAERLAQLVTEGNDANRVLMSHEVTGFDRHDFYTAVLTKRGAISTRYIVNCAGLQSDRIARLDGVEPSVRIVPFRGDYYDLNNGAAAKIKHLVYPVPDPAFPFLGVHFTRMIDGSVECGPNAVFAFEREGYSRRAFSLGDTWESLSFGGTWLLFLRHWRYGLAEYARVFSRKLFVKQLQRVVPEIGPGDITPGKVGVRAQALSASGEPVDDFKIETAERSIHVLNAPSPAATACLAIGDHISRMAAEHFEL